MPKGKLNIITKKKWLNISRRIHFLNIIKAKLGEDFFDKK